MALLRSDRPFLSSEIAIVAAWALGLAATYVCFVSGAVSISDDLLLMAGVGSGVVAVIGGLPGVIAERAPLRDNAAGPATIGFSAGLVIRLLGTVALVALCSYHLPAAKKEIAGTILAWYVYLLTVDVSVLAVLLPRQDRKAVSRSQLAKHSIQ